LKIDRKRFLPKNGVLQNRSQNDLSTERGHTRSRQPQLDPRAGHGGRVAGNGVNRLIPDGASAENPRFSTTSH
jgi:hypothetical protein